MHATPVGKRFAELQIGSAPAMAIAATWSSVGQVAVLVQTSPAWVYGLALAVPVLSLVTRELAWIARYSRWTALFCVLLLGQSAYVVVSALDLVNVHGAWTSLAAAGLILLTWRFNRNPWLWAALALSIWDATLPHVVLSTATTAALNLSFAHDARRLVVPAVVQSAVRDGDHVA